MQYAQMFTAQILILIFIVITFLFSGFEKLLDWSQSLAFYKNHFKKSFLKNWLTLLLIFIITGEIICGFIGIIGLFQIIAYGETTCGFYALILAALLLIAMLIGQRIVKDYPGAMTISVYFILTVFGIFLLQ